MAKKVMKKHQGGGGIFKQNDPKATFSENVKKNFLSNRSVKFADKAGKAFDNNNWDLGNKMGTKSGRAADKLMLLNAQIQHRKAGGTIKKKK